MDRTARPIVLPLKLDVASDPFDDDAFLYEWKVDGFRAIAQCYPEGKKCQFISRTGLTMGRFHRLATALPAAIGHRNAILDGEIAHLDATGNSLFRPLLRGMAPETTYVAFDLLWLDGEDLRARPLIERKRRLQELITPTPSVRYLDYIEGQGVALFDRVCAMDLEGMIAKLKDSPYRLLGKKSPWLKVKSKTYGQGRGRGELFNPPGRKRR